jgi:hypothetical protein
MRQGVWLVLIDKIRCKFSLGLACRSSEIACSRPWLWAYDGCNGSILRFLMLNDIGLELIPYDGVNGD